MEYLLFAEGTMMLYAIQMPLQRRGNSPVFQKLLLNLHVPLFVPACRSLDIRQSPGMF